MHRRPLILAWRILDTVERGVVWRTMEGGHELGASTLGLARAFFGAVASGAPCACWGEDGTWRILERERIDPEYRSPLYTPALAELWRRPR